MNGTFTPLRIESSLHVECGDPHRTVVRAWRGSALRLEPEGTHFLYALAGGSTLETQAGRFPLGAGMYATLLEGMLDGGGAGLVVTQRVARGMFQLGGPIEPQGRLRYIDGCTDSLLLAPPVRGDACLNHLHIPPGTRQTRHTHPSVRVGVIARGRGRCLTPGGEHALEPELAFVIAADAPHSFFTDEDALDVVVYHPDTDTGPTHEDHPMLNKTIVG